MASENLDDLLAEVDEALGSSSTAQSRDESHRGSGAARPVSDNIAAEDDMEAAMDAIMTSAGHGAGATHSSQRGGAGGPSRRTTKCTVLRIGGAASDPGICSSYASPSKWRADVDYMFFRNNVPDRHRLSAMLEDARGSAAYCCQCAWTSITAPRTITIGSELDKWVCGGCQ